MQQNLSLYVFLCVHGADRFQRAHILFSVMLTWVETLKLVQKKR